MSDELHRLLPMYLSGDSPRGWSWFSLPLMVVVNAVALGAILFGGAVGVLLAFRWFG